MSSHDGNHNGPDAAMTLAGVVSGAYAAVVSTCVAADVRRNGVIERLTAENHPVVASARLDYESAHPPPSFAAGSTAGSRETVERVAAWVRGRQAAIRSAVGSHCDATMHLPEATRHPVAAFRSLSSPAKVSVGAIVMAAGFVGMKLAEALGNLGPMPCDAVLEDQTRSPAQHENVRRLDTTIPNNGGYARPM